MHVLISAILMIAFDYFVESIFLLPEPDNDCEHTSDQDESNQADHSQDNVSTIVCYIIYNNQSLC